MKIFILIIMTSQLFAYYDSYNRYLDNKTRLENKRINLEQKNYERKQEEKRRINERINRERINSNTKILNQNAHNARMRKANNEKYNNRFKPTYIKKEYNPRNYKNKPQIKIGNKYMLGIKSIEPFKNNKYIIKAENGTFALSKQELESAKKINFNSRLKKWNN